MREVKWQVTVYLLQKIDNGYVHAVYASYMAADRARTLLSDDIKKWQIVERIVWLN